MANKTYLQRESEISFKSSGGTVAFTPTSVANAAGRISAQYDFGAAPKPGKYTFRWKTAFAATPTLGAVMNIFIVGADDAAVKITALAAVT